MLRPTGAPIPLTGLERSLLAYLAAREGELVPRGELLREVWGYRTTVRTRAIDNTVRRLRVKIEAEPGSPVHLQSPYGGGLRLVVRPAIEDDLVGREQEMEAVDQALAEGARLVTVLGPGGVGKTRLLRAWVDRAPDRVFVDLTEARGTGDLQAAVAEAIGCRSAGDHLVRVLAAGAPLRLVLDNVEQIRGAVASALSGWVTEAPTIRWLATSRAPLDLACEHRLVLSPLPVPPAGASPAEILASPAARLLIARASRVGASVVGDPGALSELVGALGGLPLAIELAARRLRVLTMGELIARLGSPLAVLTHGLDAPSRHRSLRDTLAWSWEQLDGGERRALAECSLFCGGFDLADAESVLSGGSALDRIQGLVEHGLLTVRLAEGARRFDAPLGVREFALERLDPESPAPARHSRWFARLGTPEALRALSGADRARAVTRLLRDRANLLAAIDRAPTGEEALLAAEAVIALLMCVGPLSQGEPLLAGISSRPDLTGSQRERLLVLRCRLALEAGRGSEALGWLDAAPCRVPSAAWLRGCAHLLTGPLEAAEAWLESALGQPEPPRARVEEALGGLLARRGLLDEAELHLRRSIEQHRAAGDVEHQVRATVSLANVKLLRDRLAEADRLLGEILPVTERLGDPRILAQTHAGLGTSALQAFAAERAILHLETAVRLYREVGARHLEGRALANLAAALRTVDPVRRRATLEEAHGCFVAVGDRGSGAAAVLGLADACQELGDLDRAWFLSREAIRLAADFGDPVLSARAHTVAGRVALERGEPEEGRRLAALALEPLRGLHGPLGVGWVVLGRCALALGDLEGARQALAEARICAGVVPHARNVAASVQRLAEALDAAQRTSIAPRSGDPSRGWPQ